MSQALSSLGYGAEVLQKMKLYKEAAVLYTLMLQQKIYKLSTRGYWYDRLALIYDFHLKDKHKVRIYQLGSIAAANTSKAFMGTDLTTS